MAKDEKPQTETLPHLYGPAAGKKELATILDGDSLSALAGHDTLLLTQGDLVQRSSPLNPWVEKIIAGKPIRNDEADREIQRYLATRTDLPSSSSLRHPDAYMKQTLRDLFQAAITGSAGPFSQVIDDKLSVVTLNTKQSSARIVAMTTGLPENQLKNIPDVSGHDWLSWIAAHEAGHMQHDDKPINPEFPAKAQWSLQESQEDNADAYSLNRYFNRLAQGDKLGDQLPALTTAVRAVGALQQSGHFLQKTSKDGVPESINDHMTNIDLAIEDSKAVILPVPKLAMGAAALAVNTRADFLAGALFAGDYPGCVAKGQERLAVFELIQLSDDIRNPALDIFKKPGGEHVAEAVLTGHEIIQADPLLRYAATRQLLRTDSFPPNSPEIKLAQDYVAGVEKLIPDIGKNPSVLRWSEDMQNAQAQHKIDLASGNQPHLVDDLVRLGKSGLLTESPIAAPAPKSPKP